MWVCVICPWDFPGKNSGVGCHFLLQGIFPTQVSNLGLLHYGQILYLWATKEALNKKQITVIIWLDGRVWRWEEYHSVYIFVPHGILTVQKTKLQIIFNWENILKLLKNRACQLLSFPGGSVVKNPPANEGDTRDTGFIPGLGRSPGGGHGNPLE